MKTLSHIKFIGDILVYDEPYLSLYYDFKEKEYALFLKASNNTRKNNNKYLFFYVNKDSIINFMNESAGLRDIALNKKIYTTEKKHNGSFIKVSTEVSYEYIMELESNEMFDPDYCTDYCEIIWQLNN